MRIREWKNCRFPVRVDRQSGATYCSKQLNKQLTNHAVRKIAYIKPGSFGDNLWLFPGNTISITGDVLNVTIAMNVTIVTITLIDRVNTRTSTISFTRNIPARKPNILNHWLIRTLK
jgi:hypothetical protein